MHKIEVSFWRGNDFYDPGYGVFLICELTNGSKKLATFIDAPDALRFAKTKSIELGVEVDVKSSVTKKKK